VPPGAQVQGLRMSTAAEKFLNRSVEMVSRQVCVHLSAGWG
jgi:hypothetical protein